MWKRACFSAVFILSLLLPAGAALAGLAALSYMDTGNEQKTVGPAQRWINPAGEITVYLTAGLERKVGYVVLDGGGQTVAEGVSAIITPADQFTVLGGTYYGKIMTLPPLQSDGDYTLKARILDSQGNQLASEDVALTVKRTPPTVGNLWWDSLYYQGVVTDNLLMGGPYTRYLFVQGVGDSLGIAGVQFESFNPGDGSVYYSGAAWYDATAGKGGIGNGTYTLPPGGKLPAIDGPLGLRFIVYDRAGNKSVAQATVRWNGNNDPLPELIAVGNTNITSEFISGSGLVGYEAYTPGMTLYDNPMKLLYRVLRSNWTTYNSAYGLAAVGGSVVYTDTQYVYVSFSAPYDISGKLDANYYRFYSPPHWFMSGSYLTYNLALSPTAPQSPVLVGKQLYTTDIGWSPIDYDAYTRKQYNTSVNVIQIKVIAEPRNYTQYVKTVNGVTGSCVIQAGETECVLDVNWPAVSPGTNDFHQTCLYIQNEDASLKTAIAPVMISYDLIPPVVQTYTMDQENKTVTFLVNDPFPAINSNYTRGPLTAWLLAHNADTGQEVQVNAAITSVDAANYQASVNYASLAEGNWQFTLWAKDYYQNTGSLAIGGVALDQTPPRIAVYREAEPLADHGSVASLGQVRITLTDTVDADPQLTGVRLEGGPQAVALTLAHRPQDGAYVLEYPVMFPSGGQEYNLIVSARDAAGNTVTRTMPFLYDPALVNVASTGQETLNLPALPANVVHPNGANALTSGIITLGGVPITGSYDLVVMSGAASTIPMTVQGLALAPGEQKTISAYNFAASGGQIDLPLMADGPGRVDLLITSTAPNFPVVTAQVNFWRPELQLSANPGWAVQPIIQTQRLNLLKSAGTPCRLSLNLDEAQTADPVDAPVCLVQWTGLPANYTTSASYAEGVLPAAGDFTPAYQVSIFNNGQRYQLAEGSGQALERSSITDLAFAAATTPAAPPFYRKVQQVDVQLNSTGSYRCTMVNTPAEAQEQGTQQAVCLARWTALPEGMVAVTGGAVPQASGGIAQAGEQTVAWAVDLYSPYGTVENAAQGGVTLTVSNPPLPELTFETGMYGEQIQGIEDVYVTTELQTGQVGSVKFGTKVLNTNMTLELDGIDEGHTSRQYWSAKNTTFSRSLNTGELNAYETRPVGMKLYYTELPDWKVEKTVTVMGAPSKRVQAVIDAPREMVDTAPVPVRVTVGVFLRNELTYNAPKDGQWRARIFIPGQDGQVTALTDYQPLANGVLETTVPAPAAGAVKLAAEAQAVPPAGAEYYSRSLGSNTIYRSVMKGAAPEGEITRGGKVCTVASGPVPLTAILGLKTDIDSLRVMGDVTWQVSGDGGATWRDLETKTPYQATVQVPEGRHLVRTKMKNKLSGAEGYSDQSKGQEGAQFLELIAYRTPELALSAPQAVIVGTPVTLRSQVTVDGQIAGAADVVVEWYDANNQLVSTGANLAVTPAEIRPMIYRARARLASAPADDAQAWARESLYLRVLSPKPPWGRVIAPSYFEYNSASPKTYPVKAEVQLAQGLDPAAYAVRGEWRFPDGRTVEGLTLDYSPTAQDAEKRYVTLEYAAWIDGFKEHTLVSLRRMVTVGTYFWPEFVVNVKRVPLAAPSLVTLTAAPVPGFSGRLETPVYQWRLPEPATLVREQEGGRTVMVKFPESGSFEADVTVTDARGATAEAAVTVALAEPDPFQVSFFPTYSNLAHREKLDLVLRPTVRGGHPQDRLTSFEYSVPDCPEAQVTVSGGAGIIKGLRQGERTVRLKATSLLGKVVEQDFTVNVAANQPPSCEVVFSDSGDYRRYQAAVRDPDGRVAAFRWYRDGVLISTGQSLSVRKSDNILGLRFEAEDDAGATCEKDLSAPAG